MNTRLTAVRTARTLLLTLALVLTLGQSACRTAGRSSEATLTPQQREKYVESFDEVWSTIREKHWDPKLNGADWDGARAELRPQMSDIKTATEGRRVMNQLISRLGQSHFGVIPADVYRKPPTGEAAAKEDSAAPRASKESNSSVEEPAAELGGPGTLGIEPRLVDGLAMVLRVEAGSPAAQAGIGPGWEIVEANGVRLRDVATPIAAAMSEAKEGGPSVVELLTLQALEAALRGNVGEEAKLMLRDPKGARVGKTVKFAAPTGVDGSFGNLTGVRLRYDGRTLSLSEMGMGEGVIEYVGINIFVAPGAFAEMYNKSLERAASARGLIIDLRGNPGGIGAMAMAVGSGLNDKPNQKLGTMQTRDSSINFVLLRRAKPYTGPVAILVDGASASTSEILAGGLQDLGRARVFGTRTAGAALPSVITRLPSGDRFQYAMANYTSQGGQVLEGRGVIPDEEVRLDAASLRQGRDVQIEAAARWIVGQQRANAGGSPN